jgi:hypothetical protein
MRIEIDASQRKSKYSQSNEEIAIAQVFSLIKERHKEPLSVIEFGASEGNDNSNLLFLAEQGVQTILIESDPIRFLKLNRNTDVYKNVQRIHAHVGFSDEDNLKAVLESNNILTSSVAIVSIDVDGDDAAIFENLALNPDMVIVEFNPTMSSDARFRNPPGSNIGNSIGELLSVARDLDYFPVCITGTNLIFLSEYYQGLVEKIIPEEEILKLQSHIRIGWGFDGTLVMYSPDGSGQIGEVYENWWNGALLLQPLPKFIRKFKGPRINRAIIHLLLFLNVIIFRPNYLNKVLKQFLKRKKSKS